ncbi:lytic polysaccharide monooxygenase [Brachybacterium hainanense]|uniref:Lytic polysaccharide monooxygenase n=1 Tax=Brachybacterium hainanense TaxID=1541174 RepID=A0ABV6R9B3_9MICO
MKRKTMYSGLLALGAGAVLALGGAGAASAHGWVTDAPSRQDHCASGTTAFDCGAIQYEPQSVEAPQGSMKCSGGNAAFAILDDESKDWPRTEVSSSLDLTWSITAQHRTSTWEYFVDGQPWRTFDEGGQLPPKSVTHTLDNLPEGEHTILARWNIADTANAFYSCIDVTVGAGGSGGEGETGGGSGGSTDPEEPTTPEEPGTCGAAWDPRATYWGGDTVSHDGATYRADWWTRGEEPGTTGTWGVWKAVGDCA